MKEIERRAADAFEKQFGAEPETVASAPGRINLIGEHTDYNGGFVLPCAVERRVAVAAGRGGNELHSVDFAGTRPVTREREGSWQDYPRGVVWSLEEAGCEIGDFRAAIAGDVPRGSGLSSSAAIEAATILAIDALFGLGLDRKEMARLCMKAENEFVGVRSGIMDQYASLLCEAGAALFIDCRSLEAEPVPLDLESHGLSLLVCDTRVQHEHTGSGYNDRRESCERAARTLGVKELRDASEEDLERLSGEDLERAQHIISENTRVLEAARSLKSEHFEDFGNLMYASHASMRDDFEISVREIDVFVDLARHAGAIGARLTGGGFGGCAIALIPPGDADELMRSTRESYAESGFAEPAFYSFLPAAGAQIVR